MLLPRTRSAAPQSNHIGPSCAGLLRNPDFSQLRSILRPGPIFTIVKLTSKNDKFMFKNSFRKDNYIVDPFGMPIYGKALVDSPVSGQLGSVLLDYDRNGPAYVYGHLERLRYAYEKWVKKD